MLRRNLLSVIAALPLPLAWPLAPAQAQSPPDGLAALRAFWQHTEAGEANFTQTVTQPDGKKTKTSSGTLVFKRPGQFRFDYAKPYPQTIVCDGRDLWFFDPDLNQATRRDAKQALSATPGALLVGGDLDTQFTLTALPATDGLTWTQATPKAQDSTIQSIKVGFRVRELAAMEVLDSFGQRSRLDFSQMNTTVNPPASVFAFTPPPGVDVTDTDTQ